MTLTSGSKLGPYEILESIGSGGMGEVWKARDTRLGRTVAIKKVKEQHSERFKQEARTIAALNHPNICQIFDIGDNYLVLEYVEGKPLSSPQPEQEAVRLAIQIASALEEAHQHGIIHRDLKPSNILVTEKGSVKLLDFGLAKLYEQDASVSSLPTEDMPATQAGAILGTVAYMSPEQAQGQPVNVRSDIFSFGLVLYEMLSGRRAFSGNSASETIAALLRDDPPPLQASPPLERIVKQCLQKNSSERYQAMPEVKTALEKAIKENTSVFSAEPQPSIAVLPFVNMSGDKEQEYFSDGLAEEIINALTKVPGLFVIARTSAFAFRGKQEDIRKIAKTLGVANILEGSVRKSGNRIRVTAQLIEANKGGHLWSERFDRELTDVFEIQDEISQAISEKLRVQISGGQHLVKQPTENVEAYNLYLKGRYHATQMTPEGFVKSKEYYEQAIAIDPQFALGWFGLAVLNWFLGFTGLQSPKVARMQFGQAAKKALQLDETLPEAHSIMGVFWATEYGWKEAEREFLRALELGPNIWEIHLQYCLHYLGPMRRKSEALAMIKNAIPLDPLSPVLQNNLGVQYLYNEQFHQAIEQARMALELNPNFPLPNILLGLAYIELGRFDEGIRALETAYRLNDSPIYGSFLGFGYAREGNAEKTNKLLEELKKCAQKSYITPIVFAILYYALDEIDCAMDWLEKAIDEHDLATVAFLVYYIFDPLRSHPRYKALLGKMNLEP